MTDAECNWPQRRSVRLPNFDYTTACGYFVTICTAERRWLLGDLEADQVVRSPLGQLVADVWASLPEHHAVDLDAMVVMPDHLHGILFLCGAAASAGPGPERFGRPRAGSLSSVIRAFKGTVTKDGRRAGLVEGDVWQRGYHERVLRPAELERARDYIRANPHRWHAGGRVP